jgi:ABC-2 type transport system ATP-binding protein
MSDRNAANHPRAKGRAGVFGLRNEGARNERLSDEGENAGFERPEASGEDNAIETSGLTKRYRRATALSDCSITVPVGRISALVGPNGAGKSTLLRLLTGLARPTGGSALVLGGTPRQDPAFLAEIGYLAQDVPLYRRLSAEDHVRAGAHLNERWDAASARTRLRELGIPLDRAVGTLSGGQRAQVGLSLALAKRPRLLLLDEPVAALDPLARRHFLSTLTSAVAESEAGLTVVLSSHLIADLERVCDHLILLAESRVQLCGDIDELLEEHSVLVGPRKDTSAIERAHTVVHATKTPRQTTLVIRRGGPVLDPAYQAEDISLEDLVLAYMGAAAPAAYAHLSTVGEEK